MNHAYYATLNLKVSANVQKFTLAVGPSPFGSNAAIFGWLTETNVLEWQSGTNLLRVERDEAGVYTIGFLFNTGDSAEMYFLLGGETADGEPAWAVVDDFELWKGYRDDVNEPSGEVVPETPAFTVSKTVQSFGAGANEYLVETPDEAKFANEIAVSGTGVSGTWADGKVTVDVPAGYAEETVTVTLRSANRTNAAYCKEERFTLWNENYSALAAVNTFDYARLGDDWDMSWSCMFFGRPVENGPVSRLTAPAEGINGISYAYPIPDAADGGPVMVSKADQFSFLSGNLYTVQLKVKKIPDVLFSVDIGWSFAMGCGIRLGDGSIEWSSETADKPFRVETADRGTYLDVTLTFEMIAGATDIRFFGKKPTSMGATDIVIDDVAVFEGFGRNLGTKRAVAGADLERDNAELELNPEFAAVTTDQSLVLNGMGSVLGDAPVTADAGAWFNYLTLNATVKGSTVYTLKFRYRILTAAGVKFGVTLDHARDELDDFLYFNESGVLPSEIKGTTTAAGSFPGPSFVAGSVLGYVLAPGDAWNELTVTFFSGADDGYLGIVFNCNGGGKIVFDDIELTEGLLADALAEAVKTPAPEIAIAAEDPAGKQDKEQVFTLPATASVAGGKALTYAAATDSDVAVSWDGTTVRVGALPFEYSAATLVVELTASLADASFVYAKKTITVQINTPAVPEITIPDTISKILYRGESAVLAGVTATLDGEGFTTSATAPAGVTAQWDHVAGKLTIALSADFAGDEVSVVLKAVLDADARLWAERTLTFAVAESFKPAITLPLTDLSVTKGESKNFAVLVRYAGAGVTVTATGGEGVTLSWKDDVLTVLVAESYAEKTLEVTITAAGTDVATRTETKTLTLSVRDKSTDGTVDGGDGSDEPTDGEQGGCGGSAAGAATLAALGLLLAAAALCSVKRKF